MSGNATLLGVINADARAVKSQMGAQGVPWENFLKIIQSKFDALSVDGRVHRNVLDEALKAMDTGAARAPAGPRPTLGSPRKQFIKLTGDHVEDEAVVNVVGARFDAFARAQAGAHSELTSSGFSKLCKDAKIFDKKFTTTHADLVYAKVGKQADRCSTARTLA